MYVSRTIVVLIVVVPKDAWDKRRPAIYPLKIMP